MHLCWNILHKEYIFLILMKLIYTWRSYYDFKKDTLEIILYINQRYCLCCNSNDIEDEFHFVCVCPSFNDIRKKYIKKFYYIRPSVFKYLQFGFILLQYHSTCT